MEIRDKAPVNWVKRRVSCTVDDVFEALLTRLEADIGEKKDVHPDSDFTVHKKVAGDVVTKVAIRGPKESGHTPIVELKKKGDHIQIHGTESDMFKVTPRWDKNQAECNLFVGKKRLDLWQISHLALYPLFFRD